MKLQIDSEHSTGTCAVLVTGQRRSLIANLGAANHFKRTHFDSIEIEDIMKKAYYFYSSVSM